MSVNVATADDLAALAGRVTALETAVAELLAHPGVSIPPIVLPPAAPAPSPTGSSITNTGAGSLVTADGTWTFGRIAGSTGSQTLLDGSNANGGYAVLLEVYGDGKLYQKNSVGSWYVYGSQAKAWTACSAPGVTPSPAPAATPAPPPAPTPGGRNVLLGYYGGPGASGCRQDFTINNSFQDSGLGKGVEIIPGTPVIVELDLGAIHYNATPADYEAAAAGSYDGYFTQTVKSLVPNAGIILGVRIDAEFNLHGQGNLWQAAYTAVGPKTYIAAWNALAAIVRQYLPNAKIIWNPNVQNGADVTPYFPGVEFCDLVGIDAYMAPQWKTTFQAYLSGTNSLTALAKVATDNGIETMMCEWADLFSDASNLTAMAQWIKANCVGGTYWNSNDALTVTPPNSSPILTGAKAAALAAAFDTGPYTGSFWKLP